MSLTLRDSFTNQTTTTARESPKKSAARVYNAPHRRRPRIYCMQISKCQSLLYYVRDKQNTYREPIKKTCTQHRATRHHAATSRSYGTFCAGFLFGIPSHFRSTWSKPMCENITFCGLRPGTYTHKTLTHIFFVEQSRAQKISIDCSPPRTSRMLYYTTTLPPPHRLNVSCTIQRASVFGA